MRLINVDKLRFRHTVKCNSNTTRPYTLNCIFFDEIQNAPTIKAVPIDVLDKIRAKILKYRDTIDRAIAEDSSKIEGMKEAYNDCLEVIDKYREEEQE